MLVYESRKDSYSINQPTSNRTPSASDSYTESLNSSWESSLQIHAGTPTISITRRTSFDETVKMEDLSFHDYNNLPDRYGSSNSNAFCAMSAMTQDMLTGFQEPSTYLGMDDGKALADANPPIAFDTGFQGYSPATFGSFETHCPSSDIPSLMNDLYSPTSTSESSGAMDYVDPAQTTLIDTFADFQSSPIGPLTPIKFGTPSSDFNTQRSYNNSPAGTSTTGYLAPPTNYQDLRQDSISPIRQQQFRRPYFDSPQSAAALQRIQAATPTKATTRRKIKRETVPIRVQNRNKLPCLHPGCNRKFQRQEHLKRHEHTHDQLAPKHKCPFCVKEFGRTDNLKSHIDLHRKRDRKAARTEWHADADKVWESMSKKSRKHEDSEAKSATTRTRLIAY